MDPIAVHFYVQSANFQNYVSLLAICSPTMGSQQKIFIFFFYYHPSSKAKTAQVANRS